MLLYLVQHAEAKKEEEDPARGLTYKGFKDISKVAAYAQKLNIKVNGILHSGKTRAMQTAQSLAHHLKPEKGISETDGLAPMDDPEIWHRWIAGMNDDTMLVGHLPHMARLASLLLCGERDGTAVNFKMAGIVCLKQDEDGRWAVEWMLTPEVIAY